MIAPVIDELAGDFEGKANICKVNTDEEQDLAEGKTVQYRNPNINAFKNWQNLENLKFNPNFEHRIKPEEPKFKVGDWVKILTFRNHVPVTIKNIEGCRYVLSTGLYADDSILELWQPQLGELVILKDKNSVISIIKYNGETNVYPFIGEITWLHKKD
jgi:thiol-disulfide isomerase/thioredoxin